MVESTFSNDIVYLCMLHHEYIVAFEGSQEYTYKPLSIIWDKDSKVFEFKVDLISNQQIDDNDSTGDSEFSRRTPRIHRLG